MPAEDPMLEVAKAATEGAARESVDKIASVLGAPFPFWGMRKRAVDVYVKSIENGDYTPDEKYLLIANAKKHCKELANQLSVAEIAHSSAQEGTDFSDRSCVDSDFVARFMDAARFVSDEETQLLWGNVLAKEFEEPGSTPPSIVRVLAEMPRSYADKFSNLCSLRMDVLIDVGRQIQIGGTEFFIAGDFNAEYLKQLGINFSVLEDMEQMGLITFDSFSGYVLQYSHEQIPHIHIVCDQMVMSAISYPDKKFPIGSIRLTDTGECIARFIPRRFCLQHVETVKEYLQKHGVTFSETPQISIIKAAETKTGREYSCRRL